jgi:hypothetical protein
VTIEERLAALAADVEWPPTPDVAARVRPVLGPQRPRRSWRRWFAGLGVIVVGGLAVSPARTELLDALGVSEGEHIERVAELPPLPRELPRSFAPGTRTTLSSARAAVDFPVRVPARLGLPREVRISDLVPGGIVSLVYGNRAVLSQYRGGGLPYIQKMAGPGTDIRAIEVGGAPGAFITGAPTYVFLEGSDGQVVRATRTLSGGNVLVWFDEGIAYRLELRAGRGEALRIARSLR